MTLWRADDLLHSHSVKTNRRTYRVAKGANSRKTCWSGGIHEFISGKQLMCVAARSTNTFASVRSVLHRRDWWLFCFLRCFASMINPRIGTSAVATGAPPHGHCLCAIPQSSEWVQGRSNVLRKAFEKCKFHTAQQSNTIRSSLEHARPGFC